MKHVIYVIGRVVHHLYILSALILAWSFVSSTERWERAIAQELYVIALSSAAAADQDGQGIDQDAPQSI